ncbi:MAG: acyltransferase family protein [Roseovarius sp.]
MTLGAALRSPRSGNLDTLRLLLAGSVIVSHAWPLALGPGTVEPLAALTGKALGGWAVGLFFFLSGMLITASAERRGARAFWAARARRIVPGLGAALLATLALAVASGAHPAPGEAAAWAFRALTLVSIEHRLPGAFAANPYPLVVNGPLWSLFHEVAAYLLCALFVRAGGTRHRAAVLALLALAAVAALFEAHLPGRLATFAPLFAAFAAGMAAHVWRDRIALSPALALAALAAAALLPAALAPGALGLAAVILALRLPPAPLGADISFGLYIYGWPVAQALVALQPGIAPLPLAALSLAATAPLALLSCLYVERPFIGRARAEA